MLLSQEQIEKIVILAFEAGDIAKKYFLSRDFVTTAKSDNSRVTSADLAISKLIYQRLSLEFLNIPIVCEENNISSVASDVFWLIDPIDGTSSFIDGSDQFAINIALIKDQKAIFGLIYAPLFEGGKMVFTNHKNQVVLSLDDGDKKILHPKKSSDESFKIITSPRTKDFDVAIFIKQFFNDLNSNIEIVRVSSAVKFIYLLEGKVDFYLHLRQSMEWDTAAGQALVEALGGEVKNLFFNQEKSLIDKNLTYKKYNFLNQPFIAKIYG